MLKLLRRWLPQQPAPNVPSQQHLTAQRYWESCSNTFLTNPEYYEKCEGALRESILPRIRRAERLLDAGCGNGRFTLLMARVAGTVDAFDVSPSLISQAKSAAAGEGLRNVRFKVGDLGRTALPPCFYDVVCCMGVFSTIIDDEVFREAARAFRATARTGALLLLRDSLSLLPGGQLVESEEYATRYRNETQYRQTFADLGMSLELELPLAEFGTSVNRIFLYRVTAGGRL